MNDLDDILAGPLLVAIVPFFVLVWHLLRRKPRLSVEPRCARCGYSLRGLPSPTCPECGSDTRQISSRAVYHTPLVVFGSFLLLFSLVVFIVAGTSVYYVGALPFLRTKTVTCTFYTPVSRAYESATISVTFRFGDTEPASSDREISVRPFSGQGAVPLLGGGQPQNSTPVDLVSQMEIHGIKADRSLLEKEATEMLKCLSALVRGEDTDHEPDRTVFWGFGATEEVRNPAPHGLMFAVSFFWLIVWFLTIWRLCRNRIRKAREQRQRDVEMAVTGRQG
jgi:hypothetical protein